jgi:hypothetical protein
MCRDNEVRARLGRQVLDMLARGEMQLDEVLESMRPQFLLIVVMHFYLLPAWSFSFSIFIFAPAISFLAILRFFILKLIFSQILLCIWLFP